MNFKEIISEAYCERLCDGLRGVEGVDGALASGVMEQVKRELVELELKARVQRVACALGEILDDAFSGYEAQLDAVLSLRELAGLGGGDTAESFELWPLTAWVSLRGLDEVALSLEGLKELTMYFTGEFDIRPFLERHREETWRVLEGWVTDESKHVRRLVSEGTRAYLPWGIRVKWLVENQDQVYDLIHELKDDESDYVRRSVANNLNDMTRLHGDWVVEKLAEWEEGEGEIKARRAWVKKHALRSLVKKGDVGALALLGFSDEVDVDVEGFTWSEDVSLDGDPLKLKVVLVSTSEEPQDLVVDFVIHHVKANGGRSEKVFKWKVLELGAKETVTLSKKHAIKTITTRRYYEGEHKVELKINGQVMGGGEFMLTTS